MDRLKDVEQEIRAKAQQTEEEVKGGLKSVKGNRDNKVADARLDELNTDINFDDDSI